MYEYLRMLSINLKLHFNTLNNKIKACSWKDTSRGMREERGRGFYLDWVN